MSGRFFKKLMVIVVLSAAQLLAEQILRKSMRGRNKKDGKC
jgi:hypothetical protein